jgi:SNF2 family DNA or RNA helicase
MLAVDEATDIRNKSKRTMAVLTLGELAAYRVIMSGLITPRSPLDLFYPFFFLDWRILGSRSWYGFRARYAVLQDQWFGGRRVPIVVGYKNLEELQEKIAPHSYRLLLKDCSEAPPPVYSRREVALTDEQKRLYHEVKENATAAISEMEHISATAVIVQIIRLHQILCGIAVDEQGRVHEIAENRTRELLDLLSDYDGKAVIWCKYDLNVQRISAALVKEFGEGSVARFWGGNRATREAEEQLFLNSPACRFQVATPAAGGRGRTWTVADLVVYHSNSENLEHRDQSEERVRGMDKLRPVSSVDLIAPGTVDEKIVRALRRKIDLAAAITGDGWRAWLID